MIDFAENGVVLKGATRLLTRSLRSAPLARSFAPLCSALLRFAPLTRSLASLAPLIRSLTRGNICYHGAEVVEEE